MDNKRYELRVDLEGFDGVKVYAEYTEFSVGGEETEYTLTVGGFMDGGAGRITSLALVMF